MSSENNPNGDDQLELFRQVESLSLDDFSAFLNAGSRLPVDVTVTQNRVTMVSIAYPPLGPIRLRVHRAFLAAPLDVRIALKQYCRTRRKAAWTVVAAYARDIGDDSDERAKPKRRSSVAGRTKGRLFDLDQIFKDVNVTFFSGRLKCQIEWGRDRNTQRRGRRSKSIRYGSWNPTAQTIRIHPRLDDARVPFEFVRYIIFHEMLHIVVPSELSNGRRIDHPPAYRKLEAQYPNFEQMKVLSRELLDVLV
ncbi:MAG: DUF45 domain-containing protein [Kiritimatiellae bacterium]|nr:DUF45 domain-containing protein [Kiritimatiellia bacterium]